MLLPKEIVINDLGYFELKNKPSKDELSNYYSKKYYQESSSKSYKKTYSINELTYINNKLEQKYFITKKNSDYKKPGSFLDIGAGEGFALAFFHRKGWKVEGIDFSDSGCKAHNPEVLNFLYTGDIESKIEELIQRNIQYDLILLDNVLEHFINPKHILERIKLLLKKNSSLVVEVPNDFSTIQLLALNGGFIDSPFWITPPDHINYFSHESLISLLKSVGFVDYFSTLDFPIDINLVNENANYIKNPSAGRSAFIQKILIENEIHKMGVSRAVNFFKELINVNLGRVLTSYFILDLR